MDWQPPLGPDHRAADSLTSTLPFPPASLTRRLLDVQDLDLEPEGSEAAPRGSFSTVSLPDTEAPPRHGVVKKEPSKACKAFGGCESSKNCEGPRSDHCSCTVTVQAIPRGVKKNNLAPLQIGPELRLVKFLEPPTCRVFTSPWATPNRHEKGVQRWHRKCKKPARIMCR